MLKIRRVCVPIGIACNMKCKYCYRDLGKERIPQMNDLMRRYIAQLDPTITEALIVSGGEPLLYKKTMFELFALNSRVHKKIMTNGILFDDDLADYCNENRIELMLSHDGEMTKYHRGVDVLENDHILKAVKKVEILRVNAVVTKYNTDCMKIFHDIRDKLGREDFFLTLSPCFDTGNIDEFYDGFNLNEFVKTYNRVREITPSRWAFNSGIGRDFSFGVNVNLDGTVISMARMKKYGTVEDSYEQIKEKIEKSGDYDFCYQSKCPAHMKKTCNKQLASPNLCRIRKALVTYGSRDWE